MMGKKTRELEEQIAGLQQDNDSLQEQIRNLTMQLNQYRSQEQAIAQALMQAQTSSARIVEDAKSRSNAIVAGAEAQRASLEQEIAVMRSRANGQAAAIVEAAQQEAARRIEQAQFTVEQYRKQIEEMNGRLAQTAQLAKEQSDLYAQQVEALRLTAPTPAAADAASFVADLPESREPVQLAEPAEETAVFSPVMPEEPLQEEQTRVMPDLSAAVTQAEAPAPEPAPAMPALDEIFSEAAPEQPAGEERVWTVEEILAEQPKEAPAAKPAQNKSFHSPLDLDDLLDEITRELDKGNK